MNFIKLLLIVFIRFMIAIETNKTSWAFAKLEIGINVTGTTLHHQKKRSLIFENGGIIKVKTNLIRKKQVNTLWPC